MPCQNFSQLGWWSLNVASLLTRSESSGTQNIWCKHTNNQNTLILVSRFYGMGSRQLRGVGLFPTCLFSSHPDPRPHSVLQSPPTEVSDEMQTCSSCLACSVMRSQHTSRSSHLVWGCQAGQSRGNSARRALVTSCKECKSDLCD